MAQDDGESTPAGGRDEAAGGDEQPQGAQISDEEIRDFEQKLRAWGASLPDEQRGILALILDRASRQKHRQYEGLAVATWQESVTSLIEPYLRHVYALEEPDGGHPDGGWVSWAIEF
jgi:hypothetical protein